MFLEFDYDKVCPNDCAPCDENDKCNVNFHETECSMVSHHIILFFFITNTAIVIFSTMLIIGVIIKTISIIIIILVRLVHQQANSLDVRTKSSVLIFAP